MPTDNDGLRPLPREISVELANERRHQIHRGFDGAHDDRHSIRDLLDEVGEQLRRAYLFDQTGDAPSVELPAVARRYLLRTACVAIAAIESIDRRTASRK